MASLTSRNCPTKIYVRDAESVTEINTFHTNEKYLKGAKLHEDLIATNNLEEAVSDADVIIVGGGLAGLAAADAHSRWDNAVWPGSC